MVGSAERRLSEADRRDILDELRRPLVERPEPDLFRLGLVLDGTVSAGAWTAGALDALFEVLDAWQAAKDAGEAVPRHRVVIEIAGGASGGAVCAALMMRAARRKFPYGATPGNPFFDLWVNALDARDMLVRDDLADSRRSVESILAAKAIENAMAALLRWHGAGEVERPWIRDPFRVLMTLTNLRGVPYRLSLRPDANNNPRSTRFVSHADHVTFVLGSKDPPKDQRKERKDSDRPRSDEFFIDARLPYASNGWWTTLARHARASGAFPVVFPAVTLSRPYAHYHWRAVMVPSARTADGAAGARVFEPALLEPDWPADERLDQDYTYVAVDGGALNNSPFRLVHDRMAGLGGVLERDESKAQAAIVIISPLAAGAAAPAWTPPGDVISVGGRLIGALVAHGRYSASELLLASRDDVASRHLFLPKRESSARQDHEYWGEDALCGSGLEAFLGFLHPALRLHDFLLGRWNMRGWLRRHFTMPVNHPLVRDYFPPRKIEDYKGVQGVQIIPIVQHHLGHVQQPPWPFDDPRDARDLRHLSVLGGDLTPRLRRVLHRLGLGRLPIGGWLLSNGVADHIGAVARARIEAAIRSLEARR
ncbi:patatin-like phospholipase family protein [Elioraea thermophila]|uniref:patatin-like phospholipase family protein n=1 Tax=Elioraea thermophila TaxID=2185104 RepID=UPI000DF2023B|nr:patatin-like phospholipase family protein [Elioraea thermophila]